MKYRLLLLPLALAACSPSPQSTAPASSTTTASAATAAAVPPVANTSAPSDSNLLGQYHWQLNDATDSAGKRIDALFVRADKLVQLDFNDSRVNVINSCNVLGGGFRVENGRLQIGPMMQSRMACADPGLSALDSAISQRLQGAPKLSLQADSSAPRLQLITDGGDTLSFTGVPTAETRFGGPGETAFLEVAAQTVPCNHPVLANHPVLGNQQCLQVRDRFFDEHGLPSGTPGAWHPLNQDIEGYTHEPGIRNVVRVKRYAIKNPPADTPSNAYVLDLVVESEKIKQ
ncbi:DUF4377 domain-containing protein [Dyella sp. Tek66A03]|uniref:DUF4377 domain-containing protein n=1 Tax=Dyella sp. Tek66A03 TaxID=3458298 RepID=UPI00403EAC66